MTCADQWIAALLAPLSVWILVSGIDDMVLVAVCLFDWLRGRLSGRSPFLEATERQLAGTREKRMAIFVPLWHESGVIGAMLEHNLAAIRYTNYDVLVGVYPNDAETLDAVREACARWPRVHLAVCPHDGPTSKADCLNWIYQRMLLMEEQRGVHYDVIVTHDAEDLIYPDSLRRINHYTETFDFVQVPVLPLATPLRHLTHGVYCDEFAEYQTKDIRARQLLGSFIPSNGVGTGYRREALDRLAESSSNRVFEPECLTEDYENGIRLHALGCKQVFLPIRFENAKPVATREYFPRTFCESIRQRTRWVMGISLQGWQRHGWRGDLRVLYWYWRDRKCLAGSLITILTNAIFCYGAATWGWSTWRGTGWGLAVAAKAPLTEWLLIANLAIQMVATAIRTGAVGRIYGWRFAMGVPVRMGWANWINFLATAAALWRYLLARVQGRPLVWFKTEHAYPSRQALVAHKRTLEEILVSSAYISAEELESALASKPAGMAIGEYLVRVGKLSEQDNYEALSLRDNVPLEWLDASLIPPRVSRALPAHFVRQWHVMPFRVEEGDLFLAGPELPGGDFHQALRKLTRLGVRFQLVTSSNFERLREELLQI
ncbi:MAG: glycosyl transferase family protein [Acidobacteriales bacterium]|nr:glycosyl transferase family protein [Terriglobales bacterium]